MPSSATQKDVARTAGVLQATVSLVLSAAAGKSIPVETIERVTEVAQQLGYALNLFDNWIQGKDRIGWLKERSNDWFKGDEWHGQVDQ